MTSLVIVHTILNVPIITHSSATILSLPENCVDGVLINNLTSDLYLKNALHNVFPPDLRRGDDAAVTGI